MPETPGAAPAEPALPGRPLRILVVDDDKEASLAIRRALEHLGHSAAVCGLPQEALTLLQQRKEFDLLLIDYRMPEMTGLDLVQMLRLDGCKIPVIMMTGYLATEDRLPTDDAGIIALLRKPITLPQLARALEGPPVGAGSSVA
ncbi:MAG: response regulator [Verrucomicrobiota bacterium]